ncbi:MAG: intermembrane phospholipid transport protein YdbH family protein, partial [Hyphomicrobium sp.]
MPVTFRINKTIKPLLTLIRPGNASSIARIRIPDGLVKRGDLALALEDIEADATLGPGGVVESVFLRLRLLNLPFWTHPVELLGTAAFGKDRITFHGTTTSAAGRVVATFDGIARTQEAAGSAQVYFEPLIFALDGLQPQELIPSLGDNLTAVSGTLAASGMARWDGKFSALSGTVALRQLSFLAGGVGVENLAGTVAFDRLWPPRTLPGQILTVARMDAGLHVSEGAIQFQIDDEGRLRIERAAIGFSGGRFLLEPVTLDPQADRYDVVFRADSLDLQAVLDAANVEAAHASGSVSGRIPVSLSRRGVAVNQAILATDGQGLLRYQPAAPPAALQQEDGSIKLLRDALENFHYDRLTITLDGDSGREWRSTIHIAGNNPDLV